MSVLSTAGFKIASNPVSSPKFSHVASGCVQNPLMPSILSYCTKGTYPITVPFALVISREPQVAPLSTLL
ncbi:hypothetical protein ES703_82805 [subsurface metagenome]